MLVAINRLIEFYFSSSRIHCLVSNKVVQDIIFQSRHFLVGTTVNIDESYK